ncbi:hypothetical protein A3D62_03125 [Candidatus Kaiserbacteria bacterium RIFCSPHIGHO2_02_FULL_49_11]|uniref:Uncharacterized protein n=1 Tax=Candidatus Kaiserbacteria bacterium RIFCSPHIGHO2_02_FULL_49_11 TaxID=1798489 RepID=A0A1F6D0Q2_9BACT|nr:MAG: hypothetical protein A3D62_03125 [Candidatus Kaiserbacteria bacterium RIFCSPHIGHO2_02_FULL_49_11]
MNDETRNESSVEESALSHAEGTMPAERKSSGPLIGIIIIVLVLAVGGVYFWKTTISEKQERSALQASEEDTNATVAGLQSQSQSDEIADIEADLQATDFENLDAEAGLINQELQ